MKAENRQNERDFQICKGNERFQTLWTVGLGLGLHYREREREREAYLHGHCQSRLGYDVLVGRMVGRSSTVCVKEKARHDIT